MVFQMIQKNNNGKFNKWVVEQAYFQGYVKNSLENLHENMNRIEQNTTEKFSSIEMKIDENEKNITLNTKGLSNLKIITIMLGTIAGGISSRLASFFIQVINIIIKVTPEQLIIIEKMTKKGKTRPDIAKVVNLSKMSIYRYQKKLGMI